MISDFECLYKSSSYSLYPKDKVEDFLLQFIFLKVPWLAPVLRFIKPGVSLSQIYLMRKTFVFQMDILQEILCHVCSVHYLSCFCEDKHTYITLMKIRSCTSVCHSPFIKVIRKCSVPIIKIITNIRCSLIFFYHALSLSCLFSLLLQLCCYWHVKYTNLGVLSCLM